MWQLLNDTKQVISNSFFTFALYNLHLFAILLLFLGLSKDSGEYCDSGVRISNFDLFVGDRYFRFYETAIWNQLLYFLDQPALQLSGFVMKLADSIIAADLSQSSWLFAIVILASTTIQWLAVGYIIDNFRRKQIFR